MKAVGLMAVMVSMGLPVPVGEKSRFDLFDSIHLDIGDEQSMSDDLSTYTSHLRNMSRILEKAGAGSLVLIDEAGTGTDPEAGGATAQAILEELHRRKVRTVVTTHYGPLKLFAHDTGVFRNASMTFDQERLEPTYEFCARHTRIVLRQGDCRTFGDTRGHHYPLVRACGLGAGQR